MYHVRHNNHYCIPFQCYPKENYNITYSCDSHVIESDLLKCTVREEACSHTLVVKQLSDHSQTQLRNAEVCSVALSTADYLVDEKIISMLFLSIDHAIQN